MGYHFVKNFIVQELPVREKIGVIFLNIYESDQIKSSIRRWIHS